MGLKDPPHHHCHHHLHPFHPSHCHHLEGLSFSRWCLCLGSEVGMILGDARPVWPGFINGYDGHGHDDEDGNDDVDDDEDGDDDEDVDEDDNVEDDDEDRGWNLGLYFLCQQLDKCFPCFDELWIKRIYRLYLLSFVVFFVLFSFVLCLLSFVVFFVLFSCLYLRLIVATLYNWLVGKQGFKLAQFRCLRNAKCEVVCL